MWLVRYCLWQPFGLQPTRLLCPWDLSGKNTGAGCHSLLQRFFLTQGSNLHLLCLLHCRWILYLQSRKPSKRVTALQAHSDLYWPLAVLFTCLWAPGYLFPLKLWFVQILCPKQPPPLNHFIMEQILESVQTSHFYSCSIGGLGTKKISTHGVRFAHFNLKGRYTHYLNLTLLCCTIIFFYCIMCLQICDGKQNCSGEETC